jgi:hypothetical protein
MDPRFEWFDEEKADGPIDTEVAEQAEDTFNEALRVANAVVAVVVAATKHTHTAALAITLARSAIFRASVEQHPDSLESLEKLDELASDPFTGPFTVSFEHGQPTLVSVNEDSDG